MDPRFLSLWSIIFTPLSLLPTFNLCCPSVRIYYCPPFFLCGFFSRTTRQVRFLYYTFYLWYIMYDSTIDMQPQLLLGRMSVLLLLVPWEYSLWPFHVSWSFYAFPTPPSRWVVCPLPIFPQVSQADNCQVCRTQGRSCAGPQTMFDIFLKEVGTLFVGRHKTGPCEAAEDGVAIF